MVWYMCELFMQEELLLVPFVRLVDYICSQALIARVIENTAELLAQLRAPRAADAEKLPKPTFVALVDFEDTGMSFVPSEVAVGDTLRNSVIDGVFRSHEIQFSGNFIMCWHLRMPVEHTQRYTEDQSFRIAGLTMFLLIFYAIWGERFSCG